MAIEVRVPRRIPSCVAARTTAEEHVDIDHAPTVESPLPCFDDEDDLLPDVDPPPETRDTVMLAIPTGLEQVPATPPARLRGSMFRRVRESAAIQLALLSLIGFAIMVPLFSMGSAESAAEPASRTESSGFPTLEVEGAAPVTEEQIARRMRSAPSEAIDKDALVREELKAIAELGRASVKADDVSQDRRGRAPGHARVAKPRVASLGESPARQITSADDADKPSAKRGGRWFSPGGTMKIEGAVDQHAAKQLPLGVGDRLFAKLEVGISSGHGAPVLARLTKDVRVAGLVVAPEGAILKGTFGTDGDRIYVNFSELILTDGARLVFDGYAVDRRVPGLAAIRREIAPEERGRSDVVDETIGVAKEVMRSVASGSIVGRVAQGVADGVLPAGASPQGTGVILEVEAGTRFEVVVTGGSK